MKSSQPGGGNKPQIQNTAEEDKHRADGESLFFSLHMQIEWSYTVIKELVVEEIDFSPFWVIYPLLRIMCSREIFPH